MKKTAIFLIVILLLTSLSCKSNKTTKKQTKAQEFEDEYSEMDSQTSSQTTSKDTTSSSGSSGKTQGGDTNIDIPIAEDNRIIVACWGDSITEGMDMHSDSYPTKLQDMLGINYRVMNGGDGGETTATIAARQGGLKVYTSLPVTFGQNSKTAFISNERQGIFVTKDNKPVTLTSLLGNGISVNKVKIGGKEYTLEFDKFVWSPRSFDLYLTRTDNISQKEEIPKGTEVIFASTTVSKKGGVDIYIMGANGGYSNTADYIAQVKAMIAYHGNDKYIIVKPYWTEMSGLEEAFGNHLVDFKKLSQQSGIAFEGLTPTEDDNKATVRNQVPASLHLNNDAANVHLNKYGYHFLAHCIYEKGKALGYFK